MSATTHHSSFRKFGLIVVCAVLLLTACTTFTSGEETATLPAATPVSDATPTPWVLFDPKDADVNWRTQTPTAWPKLSRADCERGLCPPTPTPWPLPPADVIISGTSGSPVIVYVGQTIARTNNFDQYGRFWLLGAVSVMAPPESGYGTPVLNVLEISELTSAKHTHYWLFQAVNPGKVEIHFLRIDLHCPPPSACRPADISVTVEVLPAPTSTLSH